MRGQAHLGDLVHAAAADLHFHPTATGAHHRGCLLYTSDAADDLLCVDLGGRRLIKKKNDTYTRDN